MLEELTVVPNNETHQNPYVYLYWGNTFQDSYFGQVTALKYDYNFFSISGTPLRAAITLTITEVNAIIDRTFQSPDITKMPLIKDKDNIVKLSLDSYDDKKYYIRIAEVNNLASVRDLKKGSSVFLPPIEIPMLLSKGSIDIGVTGQDLVEEKIPNWDKYLIELIELGIGHANLVIAVPEFWVDVNNLEDLDDVSKIFREKMGFRLRIATKYQNLARKYLKDFGLADYILIDSQGATEGLIENEAAEVVIDISSTGQTFKSNNFG